MMNPLFQQALPDVLDYLFDLQQERREPREARARLQHVRMRHQDLEIDLLAEEQTYDRSIHYDALLRRAGEATVSVSYCPEGAVPWPLRGVHRWSEGDLVRVNTNVLQVEAAVACLDFIWDDAPVIERLVNMCLIQEEVERHPVELTDAELQAAMDRFRSAKKLFRAEDTRRWLEHHGMSQAMLERYVSETAIVPKLRDRITAGRVEEYFQQHPHDFDTARVACLELESESLARELGEKLRTGVEDFFDIAARLFGEAADRGAHRKSSLFAVLERRHVDPTLRDVLFAASPGQLIGPVTRTTNCSLIQVLSIVPGQLNDHLRSVIKDILFKDWLAERRQAARIEWCWGNASDTSNRI
jgi:putative peptide maturation system protein